jgi:hypothetical protein
VRRAVAIGLLVAASGLLDRAPALAQGLRSDRPFRGLFGGGSHGTSGQSVDLSATIVAAYDDNLIADAAGVSQGVPAVSGQYAMLQAGGKYSWVTPRLEVGITGASAFRSYNLGGPRNISQSAGFGLSAALPGRTRLSVNQSAAYSPSYLASLFPGVVDPALGDAPPTSPNYAVNDFASTSYATTAAVSHWLNRRTSVVAAADYTVTNFRTENTESTARPDGSARGLSTGFSQLIGRHSGLTVDYRYRTAGFGFGVDTSSTEHAVNLAANHTRVLSATRRAEFLFGVGVSQSSVPSQLILSSAGSPGTSSRLYRVVGEGSVAYQFSRAKEFRASYRRGVDYIVELTQPVFVDGLTASAGGSITRRLDLTVSGGYSNGAGALQRTSNFDTYTANALSHFALNRMCSVYLEYFYYFYDFGTGTILAPNVSRRLERNGVRVGLKVSTPLVRK